MRITMIGKFIRKTNIDNMINLKDNVKLNELSIGMSHDYLTAVKYLSTYLRIGSKIFGARS